MHKYNIMFDSSKCVGCSICVVACKQENDLPVGVSRVRIATIGPKEEAGKLYLDFSSTRCMHCGNAPCIPACPQNAISKREDGIVLVDRELCDGCEGGPLMCLEVCPFDAPEVSPADGKIELCTLCIHRIDQGLEPACVKHCISGALSFHSIAKDATPSR